MLTKEGIQPQSSSTRRTTRRRPRSSPRPASSAPSPSPPTWPAVVPISCWAATPSTWPRTTCASAGLLRRGHRRRHRLCRDRQSVRFWRREQLFADEAPPAQGGDRRRGRAGAPGRRPVHHRHRAPRLPPDRQPAARPCRPSGRPRRDPVLHLPGGRPDAPVRRRPRHRT